MKVLVIVTTAFIEGGGLTNSYLNYFFGGVGEKTSVDFASTNSISKTLKDKISVFNSNYYKLPPRKKILIYVKKLKLLCQNVDYDVIHIHGNSSTMSLELFACRKSKALKIVHCHNTKTKHKFINCIFNNYFNNHSDIKLACSKQAGEWIYKNKPFYVINNVIDGKKFFYDENERKMIREKYKISDDAFVYGTVGRLNKQKNQAFLIKALKENLKKNNTYLMIVGSGPLEKRLKALTKKYSIDGKVIFTGFNSNIRPFLSSFDLFVFSSKFEGYGMVVIEAQANGLCALVPTTLPDTVKAGGNCVFYNYNSLNDFQIKIASVEQIIDRKNNCINCCKNLSINGFDLDSNVQKLISIYQGCDLNG